jgi:hypothetical protein
MLIVGVLKDEFLWNATRRWQIFQLISKDLGWNREQDEANAMRLVLEISESLTIQIITPDTFCRPQWYGFIRQERIRGF